MDAKVFERDGHNSFSEPTLNIMGKVLICIIVLYSGLLLYALGVLWLNRRQHAVRIRGFFVTTAAVLSIHAYVAALFIVYPLNGAFKCTTEFWYMSTVFPLGIAIFQASNVRLWAYAQGQQRFLDEKCLAQASQPCQLTRRGIRKWLRQMDVVRRTYFYIGLGLSFQLLTTLVLFFGSRRFSPSTGFFGESTDPVSCRRGAEWIPSVFWQVFWTWLYGPWVLYKTRHIRDVHFWALQTRLAIFAGLPGTPLWLTFLYATNPTLLEVNKWWTPAMWFAPGLMVMQITSVVLPAYDISRQRKANRPRSPTSSFSSGSTTFTSSSSRKSRELAISLSAFEHQLKNDLKPLLEFSITKDFTSENIIFLRDVRNFKLKWRRHIANAPSVASSLSPRDMRTMYEDAARIYFELVCPGTAKFAINLDSKMYYDLEQVFQNVKYEAPSLSAARNHGQSGARNFSTSSKQTRENILRIVTPWDSPSPRYGSDIEMTRTAAEDSSSSETDLIDIAVDNRSIVGFVPLPPLAARVTDFEASSQHDKRAARFQEPTRKANLEPSASIQGPLARLEENLVGRVVNKYPGRGAVGDACFVPTSFGLNVFDKAYESVKYLAYTNTWKSFVLALDESGLERISALWNRPSDLVPRRGIKGTPGKKMSHITDVELYDLNLELRAEHEDHCMQRMHHGVLDYELGPVQIQDVDARCGHCRLRDERRVETIVRGTRFKTRSDNGRD